MDMRKLEGAVARMTQLGERIGAARNRAMGFDLFPKSDTFSIRRYVQYLVWSFSWVIMFTALVLPVGFLLSIAAPKSSKFFEYGAALLLISLLIPALSFARWVILKIWPQEQKPESS